MTNETTIAAPDQGWSATVTAPKIESGAAAHLICRVGNQLHAIPIEYVIEIMRPLPIEPIAGAPGYVRGLCIIRGVPAPVVDPGLLIGNQETQSGRLIAIKAAERTVALQVEAVLGIRAFDAETFSELPPLLRDVAAESVAAVGMLDSELLLTLRVARIVPEDVLNGLDRVGVDS